MKNRKQLHGENFHRFFLMALLKKGPLSLKELEDITFAFIYHFHGFGYSLHNEVKKKFSSFLSWFGYQRREDPSVEMKKWDKKSQEQIDVEAECSKLVERSLIRLNEEKEYELTEKGREEAQKSSKMMVKAAKTIEDQFLSPTAAARNTAIADFFLALIKVLAGLFSGSVGLIADGADAAIDTVSASLVWIGIKFKKEFLGTLIIISMMFVTAVGIGYESITKIMDGITATISPISMPYLVILIEGISFVASTALYFYQRYVGKRNGSLALISQSVDSKNHIYVAAVVIVGAIFSIFGIHLLDAFIGAFIAVRIFVDAFGLSKEALSSIKGEETDFSKYKMPFEKQLNLSKLETFRIWIIYSIREDNLNTKDELISSLEMTFKPGYVPILSEFKSGLGEGFDFEKEFDNLIKPLLDERFLIKKDKEFTLTEKGKNRIDRALKNMRSHRSG